MMMIENMKLRAKIARLDRKIQQDARREAQALDNAIRESAREMQALARECRMYDKQLKKAMKSLARC